ncbi:MAG: hypothetical protein F6J86_29835 [Symploca sp. SIO1B1]|nr:hypothetical protein [Symploca sp. SIO1B1]
MLTKHLLWNWHRFQWEQFGRMQYAPTVKSVMIAINFADAVGVASRGEGDRVLCPFFLNL